MSCTPEEKRQALEHALQSHTFARSDQLKAFLRFVCEAEIEGRGGDLREYLIGVEVLGRREGYSPAEDSSVRTRAYELRHKLQKLYSLEATTAPVHIVLPKGSYTPEYLKRPVSEGQGVSIPAPPQAPSGLLATRQTPGWRFAPVLVLSVVVAAALGAAVTFLVLRQTARKLGVDRVLLEAWAPLAKPNADVILCVATPLHLTVTPDTHETYGSPLYPAPPEAYPLFRQHRPLAPTSRLGLVFTDNVLGVGTMNAVLVTANALKLMGSSFQVLPERVAPISALRNRNAVLFGAPVDSDAITRTLQDAPLIVDYEPSVKEFVIRDRQTGRMAVPRKDANGDFVEVYGLVTVLNTRDSDRGRLGMVVFSGITSAGTHGAAEFFADPRSLRDLRARFGRERIPGFPAAYQVVVKCTFGNSLLLTDEYDTHKILQKE